MEPTLPPQRCNNVNGKHFKREQVCSRECSWETRVPTVWLSFLLYIPPPVDDHQRNDMALCQSSGMETSETHLLHFFCGHTTFRSHSEVPKLWFFFPLAQLTGNILETVGKGMSLKLLLLLGILFKSMHLVFFVFSFGIMYSL